MKGYPWIPTPKVLVGKHAIRKVHNYDYKFLLWALLEHEHPADSNPQRVSHYRRYEDEFY